MSGTTVDLTSVVNTAQATNQILSAMALDLAKMADCTCRDATSGATGPTGPIGPTGATGPSGSGGGGDAARMQLQWVTGAVVINGVIYFCWDPPFDGTINSLTYFVGNDSFTLEVDIAGSPVTGLSAVAVNSPTPITTNATAANTFTAGQPVTGIITSTTGNPTQVLLSLNITWTS